MAGKGTKLTADHILLTGVEFVRFVESQPDIWSKVPDTTIVHAASGSGTIQTVESRNGKISQFIIQFSSGPATFKFNPDAIRTRKYFTDIQIPHELLDSLTEWRRRIAVVKAPIASAKSVPKKISEKIRMGNKAFFTELPKAKIKGPPSSSSKLKLGKLVADYETEAMSLPPKQLDREIKKLQDDAKVMPSEKLNIRLTTFQSVRNKREECHPLGSELRVKSTS